ncbi:uncharacterized protein F5Z01DRAFT_675814 [Emericellopsis atlantica]|uniref:Rhodopsin domain-containing protein n=1 Tax=Emericellopsis atlantica TaxID=2614577 RepID=A0A9P8CMG9_9HYPO|nr:uncharacterized protein F5Z01DRAFT_675814 [Emericellopsis atlantica]KAG9252704.1 hypothetical protein F5Z01DRAFT_675814 [Emericellopsis atlantica]
MTSEQIDLSTTPGMQPPGDQESQFDGPYNSVQMANVIAFGLTYFLATVVLGLRYFQAVKLIKKVEMDLVIITISYGLSLTYFITLINLMNWGWGKHLWDTLLPNTLAYLICPSVTKLAILAVLYQINPSIAYRIVVVLVAVAIFTYTMACCVITGGPCNPLKEGALQCLENVALSHAVLNIASDFAVIAIPIPTVHKLQLLLKQKISIGCILAIGSLVVVCSIARLPYAVVLPRTEDSTYTQAILGIWSIAEINLGIICACAMRFKSLIRTYLPQLQIFSSSSQGGKKQSKGPSTKGLRMDQTDAQDSCSYQLHSFQKRRTSLIPRDKDAKYQSYKMDKGGRSVDGDSADEILA